MITIYKVTCNVQSVVCFLLGNSPAPKFYMPTFRNTLFHLHRQAGVFRNVGIYNSDAGELPRRKHATFRTRRKFEIKNVQRVPPPVSRHILKRRTVFSKTVFSTARSTFRLCSVMAIFKSSFVWGL